VFVSNYRLFDHAEKPVASMVILSDGRSRWRPTKYGYSVFGSHMQLRFRTVKLLDYRDKIEELEVSDNPFAVVTLTHLKAIETKGKDEIRYNWKRRLFRSLYKRGWKAEQVRHLYDFIDWVIDLPEEYDDKLWQEMREYEAEVNMRFVNSAERYGIKKGIEKGITKGRREQAIEMILLQAAHKLGQIDEETTRRLKALSLTRLKKLTVDLLDFSEVDDLTAWLKQQHVNRG
jgi:hypothetical protein